jgi:hypothetical protein
MALSTIKAAMSRYAHTITKTLQCKVNIPISQLDIPPNYSIPLSHTSQFFVKEAVDILQLLALLKHTEPSTLAGNVVFY